MTRPINIRVLDFETSDLPENGGVIIEAGYTDIDLIPHNGGWHIEWRCKHPTSIRFGLPPDLTIDLAAKATHHIQEAELTGLSPFNNLDALSLLQCEAGTTRQFDYIVAHQAAFERQMLLRYLSLSDIQSKFICTMKAARRVYPSSPKDSLQYLRYYANLERGLKDPRCDPPHAAGPDTWLTAMLFAEMVENLHVSPNEMAGLTIAPKYYHTCPLGEHKGKPWSEIPFSYLIWMTEKAKDMDADIKNAAEIEKQSRKEAGRSTWK